MPERRIDITTSRTAAWTCVSRAASSLELNSHYRSDDHISLLLIPPLLRFALHIPLMRRFYNTVITPTGIYEYTIARTVYIDAVFKEILTEGCDQILIFGAGFDTRALRFQTEARSTKIFELDVPITQNAKLVQYSKCELTIPENVDFLSIDFDKESLSEKLDESGFRRDKKSLFLLEGLLMYLQPESVAETFKVISRFAGEGSEVVFDYVRASVLRGEGSCYGENEIVKTVAKAGEKWHFGLEEGDVEPFLNKYDFRSLEHKNAEELERMYFTDLSGEIVGHINGTHCLVRAVHP